MFNGLLKLLGNAGHTIGQDVGGAAHNILNNLAHLAPRSSPQPLLNGSGPPNSYATPGQVPNLNNPGQNPTSVGRVWGNLVANNVADQQGYSPAFRNIVLGAHPYVGKLFNPRAGGEYLDSPINEIQLRPQQLDPYTVTHEGLHAAFDRKTPAAQAAFAKVAAQATPGQQTLLNSVAQLGHPIYGGQRPLTEVHSFLPQLNAPSPTQAYYSRYFSNPNFYQEPTAKYNIADATGFNTLNPGYPVPPQQFGDQ